MEQEGPLYSKQGLSKLLQQHNELSNDVQVAAVMGPSGAGKTTFLNALMGTVKYGTISGQVWVNGRGMKMSRLRRIMGFVPQVRRSPP